MKLTKHDFRGCRKVFSFTLKQLILNRANLISIAVIFMIVLISMPVVTLFSGSGSFDLSPSSSEPQKNSLDTVISGMVYIQNDTELSLDLKPNNSAFDGIIFEENREPETTDSDAVFLHLYEDSTGIVIDLSGNSEISAFLTSYLYDTVEQARLASVGAESTQIETLNAPYTVSVGDLSNYADDETDDPMENYFLQLFYSIITMCINICAAAYIVQTVVEEKSSKLVESLMISVRPLALILGKILAVMVFIFGMLAVNVVAAVLSAAINSAFFGGNTADILAVIGIDSTSLRVDPLTVVICIVSLLLGYITYSLIAGLSGTSCSTMEDIQAANSTSITIIMICYVAACFASMAESEAVNTITSILPMISVFCAPVQYMTGGIGFGVLAVSWLIQTAVIVFLALLCAKIYADLIIYSGKPLGLRQIIKMAKNKKKTEEVRQ